eukprot:CAMPEP_0184691116 /NCGR_PEP_ID=MMETSP0313-20130426/31_1 /TAXON_ID=2792 /ORGANISM="Porphyridium aerugineum, Strain SAG 1380-2" /LENGTH=395 /DNA_ID=CAMNT_0027148765 /DNA_START=44 /DNA_END=1231 /DNA_ORIENTATION=+
MSVSLGFVPFGVWTRTRKQIATATITTKTFIPSNRKTTPVSLPIRHYQVKMTLDTKPSAPKHVTAMDDVSHKGEFQRKQAQFRNWISSSVKDDSNIPAQYPAEKGRYHVFVSWACPWATRVAITRKLKGLEDVISLSAVHYHMDDMGWRFAENEEEVQRGEGELDPLNNMKRIREVYFLAAPNYEGRFTVPVLWDKKTNSIVNNESSEIIKMLNTEFNEFAKVPELDLYPEPLRKEIDLVAEGFYNSVNNGVYRCGFARTQDAYETAYHELFAELDHLEQRLSTSRFLVSNEQITLADIRLFVTLIRFDLVYYSHFKTNKKMIKDYPNLQAYTLDLYNRPEFKSSTNFDHIKHHYYLSQPSINPFKIVPAGPDFVTENIDQRALLASQERQKKFA